MINHITHAGVLHVEDVLNAYQNNTPSLLISILDNNSRHSRPEYSKFHNYLALTFKDRCEEDYGLNYNWPDEPTLDLTHRVLFTPYERLVALSDAELIVDFVETHHAQEQEFNLIVHCKSGVGRSAAIAEFFGIVHNIPYKGTDPRGRFMPNCRVTRMLTKAYHNKYEYVDNGTNAAIHKLGLPRYYNPASGF